MDGLFRINPALPVTAVKTYQAVTPLATHWRAATCAEVCCPYYLGGWQVRVEGLPPDMLHTARTSGRKFTERAVAEGETWLVFEAGQACFRASTHRLPSGRPERLFVADGDWRGNPTGQRREHTRADDWIDDFAGHQDRIKTAIERG